MLSYYVVECEKTEKAKKGIARDVKKVMMCLLFVHV